MTREASCSNVGGGAPKPFLLAACRFFPALFAAKPEERPKIAAMHKIKRKKELILVDTIVVEVGDGVMLCGWSRVAAGW